MTMSRAVRGGSAMLVGELCVEEDGGRRWICAVAPGQAGWGCGIRATQ